MVMTDLGFQIWASQGIAKIADLYNENLVLMSFQELKSKYEITANFFLNFYNLEASSFLSRIII